MLVEVQEVEERVGLFTVDRPDGLQRLVVDPRPTNAAWGDPPPIRLTAGPLLARQLQRGRRSALTARPEGQGNALIMKFDLSDFYYNLRIPHWMARWFALPSVPGWLVGKPEQAMVDVGLGVLPMGSSHAVVLAQEAHLEILRRAGLPFDRRLSTASRWLRRGRSLLSRSMIWSSARRKRTITGQLRSGWTSRSRRTPTPAFLSLLTRSRGTRGRHSAWSWLRPGTRSAHQPRSGRA